METKSNVKKKAIVIAIILVVIAIIAVGIFFAVKYYIDNKNREAKLTVGELGISPVCYDSTNQRDITFKFLTVDDEIAYSMDYACEQSNENTVKFKQYLSDQGMAILMNAYPRKTPEEMGCKNADEAYMATQMAIWEIMNRTSEASKSSTLFRVKNVTPVSGKEDVSNRIVEVAQKLVNSAENDPYNVVPTMVIDNSNAKLNSIAGDDAHKILGPYSVDVESSDKKDVKFLKVTLTEAPENAKIVDENGNEKTIVSGGDKVYIKLDNNVGKTDNVHIKFSCGLFRRVGYIYTGKSQDYLILARENNSAEREVSAEITFE